LRRLRDCTSLAAVVTQLFAMIHDTHKKSFFPPSTEACLILTPGPRPRNTFYIPPLYLIRFRNPNTRKFPLNSSKVTGLKNRILARVQDACVKASCRTTATVDQGISNGS
jgi:hypothetical protein